MTALFAGIWEQDGGPAFAARHNVDSDDYQRAFDELVGQGFRLTCVDGFTVNDEPRFAAVWDQDGGPGFVARHNIDSDEYQRTFDELVGQGFRLIHVSGYAINGEPHFAAIWQQDGGPGFVARHNIDSDEYQRTFDQLVGQGFRLRRVSAYQLDGQDRFAAIWQQDGGPSFAARHNLTSTEYQQAFDQLVPSGFRLRQIAGYDSRAFHTLEHFTFAGDISAEDRARLIDRHRFALARINGCNNLSQQERDSLNATYGRAIHHGTSTEAGVNASATVGGSTIDVNFGVLFPQGDEEISQTLVHEMMHCAGFTHPERRDPPPGSSCASPDPALFDCPNDNGQYYGTPPLLAEFCIAGDQSDVMSRLERKAFDEHCVIQDGVARISRV